MSAASTRSFRAGGAAQPVFTSRRKPLSSGPSSVLSFPQPARPQPALPQPAHPQPAGLPRGSRPVDDPYQVSLAFPQLWSQFLWETTLGNVALIMQLYGCSDRCARKWLTAEGGANGAKTVIAARRHPAAYARIMIAAE